MGSAHAALITINDSFIASGLSGGSTDPITGSFDISFDNSVSITGGTPISASINIPVDGSIEFDYIKSGDLLVIGGSDNGAGTVSHNTNDFSLVIANVSTSPAFADFAEAEASASGLFVAATGSLTPAPASAPEPASLALLGVAIGGLAAARRKQQKLAARTFVSGAD
jgi:PEP-CTERM motif